MSIQVLLTEKFPKKRPLVKVVSFSSEILELMLLILSSNFILSFLLCSWGSQVVVVSVSCPELQIVLRLS